ncbi:hypothetical protein ACHAP5_008251 [Fusarium lateritium]
MATPQEAEETIREITEEYGYLDREMMDDIGRYNVDYRRRIDENWLRMENAASHSIKVLARNIYGSGARFVFELLQNAEDNLFKKADGLDALPFISFKIYPKHIIVDCNEDGFTRRDLKAICSVGESTKSALHGYIGAKGIGFKSVFIAASRVHIQSGNFSFEFRHNKTDPGLGMVRPIWVTPVDSIPSPLTRTTLYLHDQGEEEEIEHLKRVISMQFDDLQETCLLFLQKLRQISVAFYDEEGNLSRSKQFRKHKIDEHRISLETINVVSGAESTKRQIYHITKQFATGVAPSDNREPPKTEEARRISATAEVVLAFPLTSDYKPQISRQKQELFAFLPLRTSDYKFHIHSDFDTNANRQDIITTSRRNLNIRNWIATAFYQAVLQFCEHPTLCYHWPLFLPSKNDGFDSFWSGLDVSIQSLINKNSILKSRNRNALRSITDVVVLANDAKDQNGDPLFDNPITDPFLSPKYSQTAVEALKEYGLKILHAGFLFDLLKSDLNSANSRMRGKIMPEEWHSRAARLLLKLSKFNSVNYERMRSFQILPLRDGRWTSSKEGAVYLPATGDIDIPVMLDLRVLSPAAVRNPDRRALFEHIGVAEATTAQIRESINAFFVSLERLSVNQNLELLTYLYLTHQTGLHPREHYKEVWVNVGNSLNRPHNMVIYLPGTDHPYRPESLLTGQGTAPDFEVAFLRDDLFKGGPIQPSFAHPSWKEWLVDCIGIHERLSLLSPNGDALSQPFLYVFNHHTDKFLGLFEHLWLHEGKKLLKNTALVSKMQNLSAKQLCKVNFLPKLKNTWLPFPRLQDFVQRYMEHPDQFPFLKIESEDTSQEPGMKWNFLTKHFSVGNDDDIEFLLEILTCIKRSCPKPSSIRQSQRVNDLYVAIYAKLAVSNDQAKMRLRIREFFDDSGILYPDEEVPRWTCSSSCLWAAPPDMATVYSLKSTYTRRGLSEEDMSSIENLFHRTLGIRNAAVDDLVAELDLLRDEGCDEDDRMLGLYRYLHDEVAESSNMRLAFEEWPLIFVRQQGDPGWYRTSDCLWSSATPIRGKVTLDESYEELEDFFVSELGVKSLTLQMVYDDLRQSPRSSPEEVKVAILSLNEFLQIEPAYLDPEPIRKARVFPIRYPNGTVSLGSIDVDFAIGDREKLKTAFEDRISLLNFDLEEARRLKPLFDWLRLSDRYLSSCVKEDTSLSGHSGLPILSGKRYLRTKAYHITRVAATFNSPRFRHNPIECYENLRTMDVIEVDEISSVLKMSQNGQLFESKVATANEHIAETGGKLTIYVPREPKAQEICFGSVLPRKLAAWLMRHPKTQINGNVEVDAVFALTSIFASDKSVLDEILDDQGIIKIPFDNDDESESWLDNGDDGNVEADSVVRAPETDQSSKQEFTPTNLSETDASSQASPILVYNADLSEDVIETVSQRSNMSRQVRSEAGRGSSEPATVFHPSRSDDYSSPQIPRNGSSGTETAERALQEDVQYRLILERVVEAARKANFPSGGSFDMQGLREALPDGSVGTFESFDGLDVMNRFRSSSQQERDKKIGAAGELYVFELLSKLELPDWSRENWQSTIRTYAAIHPDYAGLSQWCNRETADLVYIDSLGRLTNTLIDAGILTGDGWSGKRPKYYFEVKTTTGHCKTPFYMSGKQYRLVSIFCHLIKDVG